MNSEWYRKRSQGRSLQFFSLVPGPLVWGRCDKRATDASKVEGSAVCQQVTIRSLWRFVAAWVTALCVAILTISPAYPQLQDSFEGGQPRWRLLESDCQATIVTQEISITMPHTGQTAELWDLACNQGTYAYIAYPLQPSAVIDELQASVWVRSALKGFRVGVRVVFPRTVHPSTGQPLSAYLWGETYGGGGNWQRLTVGKPHKALAEQVRVLRQRFGSQLDFSLAFVDGVVLNVYAGAGRNRFQIDDLAVEALIPVQSLGPSYLDALLSDSASMVDASSAGSQMLPLSPNRMLSSVSGYDASPAFRYANSNNKSNSNSAEVLSARIGSLPNGNAVTQLFEADSPRWIQYQGESIEWLASLGFNGLLLSSSPTTHQLEEAKRLRLKLVSPPPPYLPTEDKWELWNAVGAWFLGASLDQRHMELTRQEATRASELPVELQRPLIAEPIEQVWNYSRIANVLLLPSPPPMTNGPMEVQHAISTGRKEAHGTMPCLVSITTQPLAEWVLQAEAAEQIIGESQPSVTNDWLQTRMQVYRSMAGGARGICFRSRSSLDSGQAVDQVRFGMLQWVTGELQVLSPWLSGGQITGQVQTSQPTMQGVAISTPRSQLIVIQDINDQHHPAMAPPIKEPLRVTLPPTSQLITVNRITDGRLEPLSIERVAGGAQVTIQSPRWVEMIVLSNDANVTGHLTRQFSQLGSNIATGQIAVAADMIHLAQRVVLSRSGVLPQASLAGDWQATNQALRLIQAANRASQSGDFTAASRLALDAMELAQGAISRAWQEARAQLVVPQSSPFLISVAGLPLHWELGQRIGTQPWQEIILPGGNMDDLQLMLKNNWTQDRRKEDEADSLVEILPNADPDGRGAMRLAAKARPDHTLKGGYSGATMRIRSGPINVQIGHVIRIEGRVLVRGGFNQPQAGLLVYDDHAGPALGQLTAGPSNRWLPVSLYRMATRTGAMHVLMELRGEGDVLVDSLSVSTVMPGPPGGRYDLRSYDANLSTFGPAAAFPGSADPANRVPKMITAPNNLIPFPSGSVISP